MLDASERNPRVRSNHLIQEDHSCFEFVDETLGLPRIIRPGTSAQSEAAIIGDSNRVVYRFDTKNGSHRPEKFFLVRGSILRNICEHGWGIVITRSLERMSARQQPGAGGDTFLHV